MVSLKRCADQFPTPKWVFTGLGIAHVCVALCLLRLLVFLLHEFSLLVVEDKLFVYVNVGERGGELREAGWKHE